MTAQRTLTDRIATEKFIVVQEAVSLLSANAGLRRLVWVCEVCGMVHLSTAAKSCDSCGSTSLVLQSDTHSEISSRC